MLSLSEGTYVDSDARFLHRKALDSLKVKLHFHGLKYIFENDVMDEQARRILHTQSEGWIVQHPQRKGFKPQDSNEPATVNDTEALGSGSDDSDDKGSNDEGSGEDHDFDDSNDSYVSSNEDECDKEDDNDNVE